MYSLESPQWGDSKNYFNEAILMSTFNLPLHSKDIFKKKSFCDVFI